MRKIGMQRLNGRKPELSLQQPASRPPLHRCCLKRCKPTRRSIPTLAGRRDESELVEDVLRKIDNTDGGALLSREKQSEVNELLLELEKQGQKQHPRPLKNPDIFGNYNVAFSSTQRAPRQDGQPAGGRFRSGIGRQLFKTTSLSQSIIEPTLVINKVGFLLFGSISSSVGLRGRLEEVEGNGDTVKVSFEPPRLTLGRLINLPIGPRSSVILTTTYLSPTVRLGKGSRGSLFVFTKGGSSDNEDLENVGLGRCSPAGWALLSLILAALCKVGYSLWSTSLPGKAASLLPAALVLFIGQAIGRDLLQPVAQPQYA